MSLHFLLDGYNVIHQMPIPLPEKLENQREALVGFIVKNRLQGSVNNKVTIVFDGRSGIDGRAAYSQLEVLFSADESADEKIKRIVQQAKYKKNIVVVTNDRGIKYAIKASGAKHQSVEKFLTVKSTSKGAPHGSKPAQSGGLGGKKLSKTLEYKINSELKEIWTKPKRKRKT